jgi:hypothetical protein
LYSVLHSRPWVAIPALTHVSIGSRGLPVLAGEPAALLPLGPAGGHPFGCSAIVREIEIGQACAIHDTNPQQVQIDVKIVTRKSEATQSWLLAAHCYELVRIGQENC